MGKEGESRDGQACAIPSPIEMCAHVEVTNAAGETVAAFEPLGFRAWKAKMQKELGVKQIAVVIEDVFIIDTAQAANRLPPGSYKGVLLTKAPIPPSARRELKDCDAWSAI